MENDKKTSIEDVRERCRAGAFRAYTKGRDIYLEDRESGASVWLNEREPDALASRQAGDRGKGGETPHGGRRARLFGDVTVIRKTEQGGEGPYRGFLMVQCEGCGRVKGFCAKRETYGFRCDDCGEVTPLERLRPMYLRCKCGKEFRYKTNLTDKQFTWECLGCHAPVDLMLNARGTAYVTVGDRR